MSVFEGPENVINLYPKKPGVEALRWCLSFLNKGRIQYPFRGEVEIHRDGEKHLRCPTCCKQEKVKAAGKQTVKLVEVDCGNGLKRTCCRWCEPLFSGGAGEKLELEEADLGKEKSAIDYAKQKSRQGIIAYPCLDLYFLSGCYHTSSECNFTRVCPTCGQRDRVADDKRQIPFVMVDQSGGIKRICCEICEGEFRGIRL